MDYVRTFWPVMDCLCDIIYHIARHKIDYSIQVRVMFMPWGNCLNASVSPSLHDIWQCLHIKLRAEIELSGRSPTYDSEALDLIPSIINQPTNQTNKLTSSGDSSICILAELGKADEGEMWIPLLLFCLQVFAIVMYSQPFIE
jgi:hypothetical protein